VAVLFGLLAVGWTFPLVLHLSSHLPGPTFNDNMLSLWNFWSMRAALATGTSFFYSPYLFAPLGIDLTVYTHTALPAFVGATALGRLPLVSSVNVMVIAALALNGFVAYVLAWRLIGDRAAAVAAGVIFACCPYLSGHLTGHFDLIGMWTIPLFSLVALRALEGRAVWAPAAGAVVGLTAYVAYYYAVYELLLLGGLTIAEACAVSVERRGLGPRSRRGLIAVGAAIGVDVLAFAVTLGAGGFDVRLGPVRIFADDTFNQLQLFWVLLAMALWLLVRPRMNARFTSAWNWSRVGRLALGVGVGLLVVVSPLLWHAVKLIAAGQYVTQTYFWRSAPIGVDVATLFMGNPFHSLWGPAVRAGYARLGIDPVESGASLGLVPLMLAVVALAVYRADKVVRVWSGIGVVFFVLALGSHVHVAGLNTGLIAPTTALRYLPVFSNVRIPGRAMAVASLAVSLLAAVTIARASKALPYRRLAVAAVVALVLIEDLAAPFPLTAMACPAIYGALRDRPERGSLAELPLGLGDGLANVTPVDERALLCQTIHGRPLVGGVTSRLPPRIVTYYRGDPLIRAWLLMSGMRGEAGETVQAPPPQVAGERLAANGIAFVLLNHRLATPALANYVEHGMPLQLIATGDDYTLYATAASR
jgi:hypothetical protein